MASSLIAAVDADGKAIRVTMPIGVRPTLLAVDPSNGNSLYVVDLPDSGGFHRWKITIVQDMVVLLSATGIEPLPVLVNTRVRQRLGSLLRHGAHTGKLDSLKELRLYHGVSLVLFHEGDFIGCQNYLSLLQDLEPCTC